MKQLFPVPEKSEENDRKMLAQAQKGRALQGLLIVLLSLILLIVLFLPRQNFLILLLAAALCFVLFSLCMQWLNVPGLYALRDWTLLCSPGMLKKISQAQCRMIGRIRAVSLCNLAVALSDEGDVKTARETLLQCKKYADKDYKTRAPYLLNAAHISIEEGNTAQAQKDLEELNLLLGAYREKKGAFEDAFTRCTCALSLAQGITDGVQEKLDDLLSRADTPYQKAFLRYQSARCASLRGDMEKCRSDYEFVRNTAPEMAIGQRAARELERLAAPN